MITLARTTISTNDTIYWLQNEYVNKNILQTLDNSYTD